MVKSFLCEGSLTCGLPRSIKISAAGRATTVMVQYVYSFDNESVIPHPSATASVGPMSVIL